MALANEMESEGHDEIDGSEDDFDDEIVEELEKEVDQSEKRKHNDTDELPYKKRKKDPVRPPTVQELNQLRETENLFNSSLFRMQIEEMLKELQMKSKYQNLFNEWLNDFKSFVYGLESSEHYDLTDISWVEKFSVKPPVELIPACNKGSFQFTCPDDVTIGGSYSVGASLGPLFSIDLHVHLPKDFFDKNDILNLRFDRKRALYLTMLAEALIGNSLVEEVNFVQANGCILKPLLELKPAGKLGKHVKVLLWPVTDSSAIMLQRLRPVRGNIYPEWFLGSEVTDRTTVLSPHYNSGVAQDLVWRQNQQMLLAELSAPSLQAGLILLKVWLRQRRVDQGYGGFGGFIMAMFLVYLVQNKRLNKLMSSYQVARVAWHCLAESNWMKEGISLSSTSNSPPLNDFHQHFEVVFVDVSGFCNLCANVRKEVYMQVRRASAQAISLLDTSGSLSFQALFMTPVEFHLNYDHLIRFQIPSELGKTMSKQCHPLQVLSWAGWIMPQLLDMIIRYLRKGLGERVFSIGLQPMKVKRWSCYNIPPLLSDITDSVLVGLDLNPSKATEQLEMGPEADQPEAKEFRSFWGELSQLRRFREGRICETVLWPGGASPVKQIVKFVLEKFVRITDSSYLHISSLPENFVCLPRKMKHLASDNLPRAIIISFDALTKQLRALSDVTLSVNTVQGISPLFRHTEAFPPLAVVSHTWEESGANSTNKSVSKKLNNFIPHFCPPVEAVMTLELSGKWPRNLEAVRRLKAAFCLQLAKALQKECSLSVQAHVDHVDIYKDGYVFRLWLAALKEVALMKERVDDLGTVSLRDTPLTRALEEKLVVLPKLCSSLNGLNKQYPGFGKTASVSKRWVSSQLLGPPHIPELVTELLVAFLFVSPEPFCQPAESQLGLLLFLRLVSSTDWRTVPIIVNLNGEFSREHITKLETQFHSSRNGFPPLFLATPYDRSISQCTRTAPTLQMLIRLQVLASEALKVLDTQLLLASNPDIMPIFRPNLKEYHVIIKLKRNMLNRNYQSVNERRVKNIGLKAFSSRQEEKFPVVDFDPAQLYLSELRVAYSDSALFLHDHYGGNVIGVVWKPSVTQEQNFRVSALKGHKPTKGSKMILNKDAILEDFKIIGSGLVESVETLCEVVQQTESTGVT